MKAAPLLCLSGWLSLCSLTVAAQGETAPPSRSILVKLTPQYVVVSGYWVELEQRLKQHSRQSVLLTPQLYTGPTGRPDASRNDPPRTDTQDKVRGAGVQVLHRFYLTEPKAAYPSGMYVSYGPNFQHFAVSYQGMAWEEVIGPTGLPTLEFRFGRHTETINRYGGTVQVGYQVPLSPGRVFLDLYAGAGWRESKSRNRGIPISSRYQSGSSDYGHQGFYFPAGVKIGVALP